MVVGFHPMGVSHTVVHYPPKEAVTADIILIFHEHSGSTLVDLLTKYSQHLTARKSHASVEQYHLLSSP